MLINLVADLEETVSAPGRAGLAANQIGVSRRVFVYNVDGQVGHLVNPVIEAIESEQEDDEGCLSIPGMWYPLRRAQYARVRGVDRLGQLVVVEGEGLLTGLGGIGPDLGFCREHVTGIEPHYQLGNLFDSGRRRT